MSEPLIIANIPTVRGDGDPTPEECERAQVDFARICLEAHLAKEGKAADAA